MNFQGIEMKEYKIEIDKYKEIIRLENMYNHYTSTIYQVRTTQSGKVDKRCSEVVIMYLAPYSSVEIPIGQLRLLFKGDKDKVAYFSDNLISIEGI